MFNNGYGNLAAIKVSQIDNGAGADNGKIEFQTATDSVLSTKLTILDTGAATFSSTIQSIGQIVYSQTLGYVSTSYQSYAGAQTWYVGAGNSGVSIQPFVIGKSAIGNSPVLSLDASTNAATFSSSVAVGGGTNGGATFAINNGGSETKQTYAGFSSNLNLTQCYNIGTAVYVTDEYRAASYSFKIGTTPALTIASTGAATFSSNLTVNGIYNVPSTSYFIGNAAQGYRFNNAANSENLLIIKDGGNVLIGTTTDIGQKLTVSGNIVTNGTVGTNIMLSKDNTGGTMYGFFNDGAGNYTLTNFAVANVANINMTTGVYTPLSDVNKKKDFEQSALGLDAILGLKPTLYRMKDENNTDKHLGFIAQEVKEFIPQAFVDNGDFIGLDYQAITATLVKAIQELKQEIETLKIK